MYLNYVKYGIKCAYSKVFGNVSGTCLGHMNCKKKKSVQRQ